MKKAAIDNGLAASACNKVFRKSLLEKYLFLEGKINEDICSVIPAVLHAKKLAYTQEVAYYYVQRDNSIMKQKKFNKNLLDIFEVLEHNKKLLEKDISPIVCVGETLEEREESKMFEVVEKQVKESLNEIDKNSIENKVVIAYEPIWAIGTGKTATAEQENEMCKYIRDVISKMYDEDTAQKVRIQYGGSVKPSNANEILNMSDIDGALVGGASLTNDFVAIVNY